MSDQIRQLENAQKLNAVINALCCSWVELEGEEIETLLSVASEYGESIKSWLTNKAEGEHHEHDQQ
ncbi:hypothetical protein AH865_07850 [Salmonella enterica subsp. enterica serovar Infantis]|nr:hypothetical protein [Salmonella enterica subsp. enterica serovar Infantis]EGI5077985.1 hypothetical protein [Salmonella enterica subsp. enterica serovar Infantis]